MGRFGFYDDEDEDVGHIETDNFSVEEAPHPIPFSTQLTPSWSHSTVDPSSDELKKQQYAVELMLIKHDEFDLIPRQQCYPPSSHYWDPSTTSVSSMLDYEMQHREEKDDFDGIMQLLQIQRVPEPQHHVHVQNEIGQKLITLSDAVANENKKLEQWTESYKAKLRKQHSEAFSELRGKIKTDHAIAKKIIQTEKEEEQQQADDARREQEALDEAQRKEDEDKERIRRDTEEKQAAKVRQKTEQKEEVERQLAEKYAFVTRGKRLVDDLVKARDYIQPFDTCKAVSKRRMAMKRLCRGRVNTISADVGKIQSVSREIVEAIKSEKDEDKKMKDLIDSGNPEVISEMTRGHEYFIDLLASSMMVRIQAEGFNGPRGDGFPLAGFLAAVASEIPEFVPILEGHIYTVCPLAIPFVASLDKNADEDKLMESLGMVKNKEGAYESFERFLQRTEGIISIMANVISSHPSNHELFGGHKGAMQWLNHFVDLLPPSPEQLPLFAACVLDAFLTGSGHMLANLYADRFKQHITDTFPDILKRLDEGAIGAPSAHRLKETLKTGFEGFRTLLPPKALAQMYNNGGNGPPPALPPAPSFGSVQSSAQEPLLGSGFLPGSSGQHTNSPFGQPSTTNNNVFGASTTNNNPFGQTNQPSNTMPDGNGKNEPEMVDSSTTSSGAVFGNTQNSFGAPASNASPFGAVSTQPNSFGASSQPNQTNPFGASSTGVNTFGGGFHNSQNPVSNQPSPFGAGSQSSQPSPFGASNTGTGAFGGGFNNTQSPFGGNDSSNTTGNSFNAFGNSAQQNTTPFGQSNAGSKPGGKKAPCKFFAQGKCRYGDKCRFSHETTGNQSGGW